MSQVKVLVHFSTCLRQLKAVNEGMEAIVSGDYSEETRLMSALVLYSSEP